MIDLDRKERISQAIISAFAEVVYPGDDHIALHPESDKGEAIEQDFKGHHWRDLPQEIVGRHVIIFFRRESRQFFLPAFLLAALDKLPRGPVDLYVYPLKPADDMTRFEQEYDAYTSAQKEAIRLFLEYTRDEASDRSTKMAAHLALERYWGRDAQNQVVRAQVEPTSPAEQTRKERVRQIIRKTFADVPYPGDKAIAYRPNDWQGKDINLDFTGYHWRELPHAVLSYYYYAMSFFSPEGMQFYLPAYLLAALDGDDNILDRVIYTVAPLKSQTDDDFKGQYTTFTPTQRCAVRTFLEYVRDELPEVGRDDYVYEALNKYWGKFAPEQPTGA